MHKRTDLLISCYASSLCETTVDCKLSIRMQRELSESSGCCYFRNFTVFAIFANELLAFSFFLSHVACLFLCYCCICLTWTYTLHFQAKSSFLFVYPIEYRPMHRPILYLYLTGSPIYCRHTADAISTEGDPIIGRDVDHIAADARPTLARYSTDTRWIHRPRYRLTYRPLPSIEAPYKTQVPKSVHKFNNTYR